MDRRDQYVALVSSLPSSERLFFAKQPPLSRLRLDRRLRQLTAQDAATLATIENVMSWGGYEMSISAQAAHARADAALKQISQPTLNAIVRERLEVRAGVGALRLREQGATTARAAAALGPYGRRFVENWTDPVFRSGRRHLWLPQAAALIKERNPKGLERHMLDVTFRQLQRWGAGHQFDFEAVVIYVLKWSIFDRWARASAEAAQRRFAALTDAAQAEFPELKTNGGADGAA